MTSERSQRIGHFLLGVAVLTWGANFGIVKAAFQDMPPVLFAALRFTVSGILVLLIAFWREKSILVRREDGPRLIAAGAIGLGLYQVFWSIGLNITSATNSALILSLQPLLATLYVDLMHQEPVPRRQYGGMLLGLGGVSLVILKPNAQLHLSLSTLSGDLLTLLAAASSVICLTIWSKPLLKRYSPLRLTGYNMVTGAIVLWITLAVFPQTISWDHVSGRTWWSLAYAILFSGIAGHVFWYEGLDRLGVTKSMVYVYFISMWAVLFNYFLMGEEILSQQVIGGALILWGVHRVLRS